MHQRPLCTLFLCRPGDGIFHQDGGLLIDAAKYMALARPHIVLLEQVKGFSVHPDKGLYCKAFELAGYRLAWHAVVDTAPILPVHRERYLMLWVLSNAARPDNLSALPWYAATYPSLHSAGALFELPPPLSTPLILDDAIWEGLDIDKCDKNCRKNRLCKRALNGPL